MMINQKGDHVLRPLTKKKMLYAVNPILLFRTHSDADTKKKNYYGPQ